LPALLESENHTSPAMIRAAVLENAAALEKADFAHFVDRRRTAKFAGALLLAILAPLLFVWEGPSVAWLWMQRWVFGSSLRWPQATYLTIAGLGPDGKIIAPRGEAFVLRVSPASEFIPTPDGWRIPGRNDEFAAPTDRRPTNTPPTVVRLDARASSSGRTRGTFTKIRDDLFQYEFPPIHEAMSVTVSGGDDWRGPFTIEPVDRPAVAKMTLKTAPPGSSEPPTEVDAFSGQHLALQDTALELQLVASVPLRRISLKPDVGPAPPVERRDAKTFTARWTMRESQTFEIVLVGEEQDLASRPIFLSIGLLKDRPPRVTVQATGVGRRVTPTARIPLSIRALDDFGLTSLSVESETTTPTEGKPTIAKQRKNIPIDDPSGKAPQQVEKQHEFQLRAIQPAVGAVVSVKAVGVDNCIQGKQRGESRAFAFQVVAPEELFYEILTRQRAERSRFQNSLAQAETQADLLAKATNAERLPGALRAQQVIDREVWQIANRLDATLVELRLNELGNPQALDLLENKIIVPLRQLHEERMVDLRQKLQSAMTNASALPEARAAQKDVAVEMRRILDQMSQWEGFVDVVNQLKQIITLEDGVLKKTEEKKSKAIEEVFEK
jgi:hypothetical protein